MRTFIRLHFSFQTWAELKVSGHISIIKEHMFGVNGVFMHKKYGIEKLAGEW